MFGFGRSPMRIPVAEQKYWVNRTATAVVNHVSRSNPPVGRRLVQMFEGSGPKILIKTVPGRFLEAKTLRTPYGTVNTTTEGLTTTYTIGGRVVGHVISLPQGAFFERAGKSRFRVSVNGLKLLAHELGGHVAYPINDRLLAELNADAVTISTLRAAGAKQKVIDAYVKGRPINALLQARQRGEWAGARIRKEQEATRAGRSSLLRPRQRPGITGGLLGALARGRRR